MRLTSIRQTRGCYGRSIHILRLLTKFDVQDCVQPNFDSIRRRQQSHKWIGIGHLEKQQVFPGNGKFRLERFVNLLLRDDDDVSLAMEVPHAACEYESVRANHQNDRAALHALNDKLTDDEERAQRQRLATRV